MQLESKLNEKEAVMFMMKENFEKMLQREQEEKKKQERKFEEAETSLLNQLASTSETKEALLQELQNESKLVEELRAQISQLESSITRIAAEKNKLEAEFKEKVENVDVLQDRVVLLGLEINDTEKNIESLKVSLSENESECKKLSSNVEQLRNELPLANSTIQQLKEELLGTKAELNSKISLIDSLNEKIQSLSSEKDNCVQRIKDLMKDYDHLKTSSDRRAAHDAELLSKKEDQIRDIEEKLELAIAEGRDNNAIIAELRKEKDDLEALLEREASTVKILKGELQSTQEALGASKFQGPQGDISGPGDYSFHFYEVWTLEIYFIIYSIYELVNHTTIFSLVRMQDSYTKSNTTPQ